MSDFSALRRNRGKFDDLTKKLKEEKSGGYKNEDDGFWKLSVDESGNGYAVIRFLPAPPGEEYPYVRRYSHGFKNPKTGKWYIELSRTTLGEDDPVSESNSELWNSGIEANKDIARSRKRRLEYISNILVIQDSKNPENEGKVFKYSYGPRIFQKIEGALQPEFEDETPLNPFDLWEGANFKLKARMLDNQRSYDKSGFDEKSALFDGDDEALEKLWKSLPSLQEEVAPEKFKSYEELKRKFEQVIGGASSSAERKFNADSSDSGASTSAPAPRREAPVQTQKDDDDDDLTAKYKALLADD